MAVSLKSDIRSEATLSPDSSFSSLRSEAELPSEPPIPSMETPKEPLIIPISHSSIIEVHFPTLSKSETWRRDILIKSINDQPTRGNQIDLLKRTAKQTPKILFPGIGKDYHPQRGVSPNPECLFHSRRT